MTMDYIHARTAYDAWCHELAESRTRLNGGYDGPIPVAWEFLTTVEKSAWLRAVSAALEGKD